MDPVQSSAGWVGRTSEGPLDQMLLGERNENKKKWRDEREENIRTAWGSGGTHRHHTCRHVSTHAFLLNEGQVGTLVSRGES